VLDAVRIGTRAVRLAKQSNIRQPVLGIPGESIVFRHVVAGFFRRFKQFHFTRLIQQFEQ